MLSKEDKEDMLELTEAVKSRKIVTVREFMVFDKRETITESVIKDGVTFLVVFYLMYASWDSTPWSIFFIIVSVLLSLATLITFVGRRSNVFTDKDELIAHIKEL